jgi:hypothetical protein
VRLSTDWAGEIYDLIYEALCAEESEESISEAVSTAFNAYEEDTK